MPTRISERKSEISMKMDTRTLSHSPPLPPFWIFLHRHKRRESRVVLEIIKSNLEIRKYKFKMVKGLSKSQTAHKLKRINLNKQPLDFKISM